MKLATIVVGVDLSDESHAAIDQAADIAEHSGARLVLLHAGVLSEAPPGVPQAVESTLSIYEEFLRTQEAEDRRRLVEFEEQIGARGIEVSHRVVDDFPDRGICEVSDELDADLVVVGSHGRTGFKRILLGSVAERVVRTCGRNVLVARPGQDGDARGYQRLLVATDFSPQSEGALAMAVAVAAPDATIDVLHCWALPALASAEVRSNLTEPLDKYTREQGEALIERYRRPGLTLHFHSLEVMPTQGLADWIESHDYQLALVGSHGRRGIRRFLIGSVAEATVRHAPISVLVVHRASDAAHE